MPASSRPDIAGDLRAWYRTHARALPWRLPPDSPDAADPYRVWLAEVMLQQTTVATAAPRYLRFLARFPTIDTLAAAPIDDVLHEWAGLGYYARARNLHACAVQVAGGGGFPDTETGLRALPGLGDYTAAAVAAIAFGQPTVPLDANLLRVGARLFAVAEPPQQARAHVRAALAAHVPVRAPGDFAQALMDLGATICTPRRPRCLLCPIAPHCAGYSRGTPEAFPGPKPRRIRPIRRGTAWWLTHGNNVALIRRPASGLLGGLLGLPGTGWTKDGDEGDARRPPPLIGQVPCGPPVAIVHGFTHFELHLAIVAWRLPGPIAELHGTPVIWTAIPTLETVGLPSLYRDAARAVLASTAAGCFEAA